MAEISVKQSHRKPSVYQWPTNAKQAEWRQVLTRNPATDSGVWWVDQDDFQGGVTGSCCFVGAECVVCWHIIKCANRIN